MRGKWKGALLVVMVVIAVGSLVEFLTSFQQPKPAPPINQGPTPPPGALNPSSAAYRPSEGEWKEYLRRPAMTVGARAPKLTVEDQARRKFPIPHTEKVSLWAVLCGCNDCADAGFQIFELMGRMGKAQAEAVLFVPNTADYVQERMQMSFGLRCRLVQDKDGAYYRKLRAPGKTYSKLPMVWGIDKAGRVKFFQRTKKGSPDWVPRLEESVGLVKPAVPPLD